MDIVFTIDQIFSFSGKLISCMVTTIVYFRFFEDRYTRVYQSRTIYYVLGVACCIANFFVYLWNMPIANLSYWILALMIISLYFYYDDELIKVRYYLTNIAMIFATGICEALGAVLVNAGINILKIEQSRPVIDFAYTVSGSTTAILLYFIVLKRLFTDEKVKKISVKQHTIYAVLTASALLHIGGFLVFLKSEISDMNIIFLLLDAVFIIFMNLYLLYLLDTMEENRDLKYKLALYERQSQSNYAYYVRQMESRKGMLSVLHDARKHIRVLEKLKQTNLSEEIQRYAEAFEETVESLLINSYCENAILNIIINDKMDYCQKNSISFEADIDKVEIGFMEPVDITTIFGNLLDNAVEACAKTDKKVMIFNMYPFNSFIYVQISNTYSEDIRWSKGRPCSQKGEGHGIGLENVENVLKKYNGTIQFEEKDEMFITELMFNQP